MHSYMSVEGIKLHSVVSNSFFVEDIGQKNCRTTPLHTERHADQGQEALHVHTRRHRPLRNKISEDGQENRTKRQRSRGGGRSDASGDRPRVR